MCFTLLLSAEVIEAVNFCVLYSADYAVGIAPVFSVILLVLLILEALVFGAFTGFMFGSQVWAVLTDETVRLSRDAGVSHVAQIVLTVFDCPYSCQQLVVQF
jgi:hypothetical protein